MKHNFKIFWLLAVIIFSANIAEAYTFWGHQGIKGLVHEPQSVEIPLCGAHMLYDNGISICGFKWKDDEAPIPKTVIPTTYKKIAFNDGSVEAWATAIPSHLDSGWICGDMIYNIGADDSWSQKIIK